MALAEGKVDHLYVFDRENGRMLKSGLTAGISPGAALSPVSVSDVPGSNCMKLLVYDLGTATMQVLNGLSLRPQGRPVGFDHMLLSPAVVADTVYTNGLFPADSVFHVYTVARDSGRLVRTAVAGPFLNLPAADARVLNRNSMRFEPTRDAFAIAFAYTNLLVIVNRAGRLLSAGYGGGVLMPQYRYLTRRGVQYLTFSNKSKWAYTDLATSPCFIYALYSGNSFASSGKMAFLGQIIHVYNWDGVLTDILRLDTAIYGIAIDSSTGDLYAIDDRAPASIVTLGVGDGPVDPFLVREHFGSNGCPHVQRD